MQVVVGYVEVVKPDGRRGFRAVFEDKGPARAGYPPAGAPDQMFGINSFPESDMRGGQVSTARFLAWRPAEYTAAEVNRAASAFGRKFGRAPACIYVREGEKQVASALPFKIYNIVPKGEWYVG